MRNLHNIRIIAVDHGYGNVKTANTITPTGVGKPYLDCITAVARQYVADLFATLRRYEYNPDLMRLYIVGGDGCLVKHFGDYPKDRVTIIGDLCATAKGYESLCCAQLQREGRA